MEEYQNIDEYIANFPDQTQKILQKVRETIQTAAPDAQEAISYGIPTFKYLGNLVHFGGYTDHIGFYPGAEAIEDFSKELSEYETSKGTIRFSLEKPIPYDLITKITAYRVEKNTTKRNS